MVNTCPPMNVPAAMPKYMAEALSGSVRLASSGAWPTMRLAWAGGKVQPTKPHGTMMRDQQRSGQVRQEFEDDRSAQIAEASDQRQTIMRVAPSRSASWPLA